MAQTVYAPDLSLSSDQQTLLRTALASNPRTSPQTPNLPNGTNQHKRGTSLSSPLDNGSLTSPGQDMNAPLTDSPLFDDLDDGTFEWDNGEQLFGGVDYDENGDLHDKRKVSIGSEDGEGNKRQEGDSKTPKKPGRKPLTAEPTTKRKAQNRAAQRAFRERKERHLKDLEDKVDDLEKASDATNHENGRLRAQVDKLTTEVKEYRKRLSLNSTANHSPPPATTQNQYSSSSNSGNDFSFAFPKFGDLPGSFLTNGSMTKMSAPLPQQSPPARSASNGSNNNLSPSNLSPVNKGDPFPLLRTTSPSAITPVSGELNSLTGLFSPQVLASASRSNSADYFPPSTTSSVRNGSNNNATTTAFPPKVHRASSASMTNSPASSLRFDSSVGTTPEPSGDSPADSTSTRQDSVLKPIKEEGGSASNNGLNVEAQHNFASFQSATSPSSTTTGAPDFSGIDFLAQQNGGTFDPVLFGDYRDPQDSVLGSMDDFFTDAFAAGNDGQQGDGGEDFNSPYNTGDAVPRSPKLDLMASVEKAAGGEGEELVGADEAEKRTLGVGEVWNRVAANPGYKSGEFDLDNLCSQFKSKAKCSSKGAVVEKKDVNQILGEGGGTEDHGGKKEGEGKGDLFWGLT